MVSIRSRRQSMKHARRTRKHSRTMKGGSNCGEPAPIQQGGKRNRKSMSSRSSRSSRSMRRTRKQRGGMLQGVMAAARTALLPVLMFGAQKRVQKKGLKGLTKL